ncbi:MAG: hypothetical protein ACRC67_33360 [Inquilinus sp.]|uniref:hypothetical protein n=1 Tax=Inquilinus sp. TaxID=1932117 RepID=UPI003F33BE4D
MKVDVVSLGIIERDGSPRIHYPPGSYDVPDDIATALRGQGVLAPETAAPAAEDAGSVPGRKGKGA